MDGYVKRIINPDGYALCQPWGLLVDGYSYGIIHNDIVVVHAIGFPRDGNPNQIALRSTDPINHPMSDASIGDIIRLIGGS